MALLWVFCIWLGSNTCLSSQFSQFRPFHPSFLLPQPSPEATIASGFGVTQWPTPYKELPEMSEGPFFLVSLLYCHPLFSNGSGVGFLSVWVCHCLFHLLPVCSSSPWSGTPPHLHSFESISHSLDPLPDGIQNLASKTQNILLSSTPWESFIVFWYYLCLHCAICSGIHLLSSASNNSVLAGEGSVGLMHRKTWGNALFSSLKLEVVLRGLNCSWNLKPWALDPRRMIQRLQNYFTKTSAFILARKKNYACVHFCAIHLPDGQMKLSTKVGINLGSHVMKLGEIII